MSKTQEIQQLINDYATFADTRQTQKQFDLFAENAGMSVYYPWNNGVADEVDSPEKLMATFEALKQYETTFHFVGQTSISLSEDEKSATAYVYTIAHHVIVDENGNKSLMIAYLRYEDQMAEQADGTWKFTHRDLYADVIENRELK